MVLNSRSSKKGNMMFDCSSSSSVMLILKTLRIHTELTPAVRNEIRDLIFSYTNGKGDEAVRQTIESRLLAVGITPESIGQSTSFGTSATSTITVPQKQASKAGYSNGRTVPSFAEVSTIQTKAPASTPAPAENKPVEAQVPTPPPPVLIPKIVPTIPPSSPVVQPSDNRPKKALERMPNPPTTPTGAHDVAKPVAEKSPTSQVDVAAQSKANTVDTTDLLERIRVIKADINARAGNPVNLVSMDNTIGREYMSALLEAMKQLGAGNISTISKAMNRLEIAYEQALSVIEMSGVATVSSSLASTRQAPQSPASTKSPVRQSKQSVSATIPSTPRQSVPVVARPQTTVPAIPTQPVQTPILEQVISVHNPPLGITRASIRPVSASVPPSQPPVQPQVQTSPIPPPFTSHVTAKTPTRVPVGESPAEVMQAMQPPSAVPIYSSKFAPAKSVAMVTPLRKVDELPTLAEVKNRSESGNPLYTQEISEGLEQLLSEWTIFRKSGVFGTGPRGSNHPLFKKLSGLKIPLIIAGRFEGATEEVRLSITDYMNGWRYEHGIVYEKEESFEEYLRRVVRHIIELQKK